MRMSKFMVMVVLLLFSGLFIISCRSKYEKPFVYVAHRTSTIIAGETAVIDAYIFDKKLISNKDKEIWFGFYDYQSQIYYGLFRGLRIPSSEGFDRIEGRVRFPNKINDAVEVHTVAAVLVDEEGGKQLQELWENRLKQGQLLNLAKSELPIGAKTLITDTSFVREPRDRLTSFAFEIYSRGREEGKVIDLNVSGKRYNGALGLKIEVPINGYLIFEARTSKKESTYIAWDVNPAPGINIYNLAKENTHILIPDKKGGYLVSVKLFGGGYFDDTLVDEIRVDLEVK